MESRIAKNVNVRCGAALRRVEEIRERLGGCVRRRMAQAHMRLMNEKGQGTTEYGRSACRDSDCSNHDVSPKNRGAVECDRQRHKWALASDRNRLPSAENGQSTVEYALVVTAFIAVAIGFSAFIHAIDSGAFADIVLQPMTHRLAKGVLDVLAF